jgi:sortase A
MQKKTKRKIRLTDVLVGLVLLLGLSLLLYPSVSAWWNQRFQLHVISNYVEDVESMSEDDYTAVLKEAQAYNKALLTKTDRWTMTDEEIEEYNNTLNPFEIGVIGYLQIPKIDVALPIYHGTDESVLQIGVGHLAGSSLPVGGESTHAVLSGHRGMPSSTLFTNLDKMEVGDTFLVKVLGETLTYEVDQIKVVEPDDVSELKIVEGEDLCTLVTCTPYGINSHRLLVRGHRIPTVEETEEPEEEPNYTWVIILIAVLLALAIGGVVYYRWRKKKK